MFGRGKIKRSYWFCATIDLEEEAAKPAKKPDSGDGPWANEEKRYEVASGKKANLIGSRTLNGLHAPTLDIDLPCQLLDSTTPGHHHLLIDKELTWEQYSMLLAVLANCGIIEDGYYRASVVRKQTFVRKPGATKETDPLPSSFRNGSYS